MSQAKRGRPKKQAEAPVEADAEVAVGAPVVEVIDDVDDSGAVEPDPKKKPKKKAAAGELIDDVADVAALTVLSATDEQLSDDDVAEGLPDGVEVMSHSVRESVTDRYVIIACTDGLKRARRL